MLQAANRDGAADVRIALFSRIDFGSDGFRQYLLETAAEIFREENADLAILAGGLVYGRAVSQKVKELKGEIKKAEAHLKSLSQAVNDCSSEIYDLEEKLEESGSLTQKQQERLDTLNKELPKHRKRRDAQQRTIKEIEQQERMLTPEGLASELAKCFCPDGKWLFTNAKGEPIKLYAVYSAPHDQEIGLKTGRLLAEKLGPDLIRFYDETDASLPLWPGKPYQKKLEVLTPEKGIFMRGDYFSTHVERVIKDRAKQTASSRPDIQVVGCFGTSILKPKGEAKTPYVAVPVLRRLERKENQIENQVGVQVMVVEQGRTAPTLIDYPLKDLIENERTFIGLPGKMTPARRKCIEALKAKGKLTTGDLCDITGLSRKGVKKTLGGLVVRKGSRTRATWSGLSYKEHEDRWDISLPWVQRKLRCKRPTDDLKVDVVTGVCCVHAGSLDTDIPHLVEEMPETMIRTGSNVLVNCGDSIEGLKHRMMERGELYAGMNVTQQEELAGKMFAMIMLKVFIHRFELALKVKSLKALTEAQTAELVLECLIYYLWILGNHDLWDADTGHVPLKTKRDTMVRVLHDGIESILLAKGLRVSRLNALVESRILMVEDEVKKHPDNDAILLHIGNFKLPSGLRLTVMHPHMPRSKTTSLRPQEALDFAGDSQTVLVGNFHVAQTLGVWEPDTGQRICVEIGTMKHGSPFEKNKMKIVDQGGVVTKITSRHGRIVRTETSYRSNEKGKMRLNAGKPYDDLLRALGISSFFKDIGVVA